MGNVVEFEVFRDHLGVAADDAAVDDVGKLYDAINAECRRLTGRQFEGDAGATYDQVIRIHGAREFTLPRVPVATITSITRVHYDGTEDDAFETTRYRLEDAERGRVSLTRAGCEYVRVVWVTTGEIPFQAVEAALEWGKERWDNRDTSTALASYHTGQDGESYFNNLTGQAPGHALRLLLAVSVTAGGGVV